jgi:hypothetical protein
MADYVSSKVNAVMQIRGLCIDRIDVFYCFLHPPRRVDQDWLCWMRDPLSARRPVCHTYGDAFLVGHVCVFDASYTT